MESLYPESACGQNMKRDWTKPQMRLSVEGYCNDFLSFFLFLRLVCVIGLCLIGPLLLSKSCDPRIAVATYLVAFPLWWWHFGLPRFKDSGTGLFSPKFCLFGYLYMSACLAVVTLMAFGVIKEGQPHPPPQWIPHSPVARFLIIFSILYLYVFLRRRALKKSP